MLLFPNAKINIGLRILNKREDGYHNLESVFIPIPFYDSLEFIESNQFSFDSSIEIPKDKSNSVIKAYELLKSDFDLPPISIYLHKQIPTGAGLGGGSADGAFMLKGLNDYFELGIDITTLEKYALEIGSDCPFFIENKPKHVTGTGEILRDLSFSLSGLYCAIINPLIHINTKQAFQGIKPNNNHEKGLNEIVTSTPISDWKDWVKNDFEYSVFSQFNEIAEIKRLLYDKGAKYASMTGTGSTVYGFFETKPNLDSINSNYFKAVLKL